MIEVSVSDDILKRDTVLQAYFFLRDWGSNEEFKLARTLVLLRRELLADTPYVYDYEWETRDDDASHGRGDLIFTDGKGKFAVVEIKYIDIHRSGSSARVKRSKRRSHVRDQALKYGRHLYISRNEVHSVTAWTFTNEGGLNKVATYPEQNRSSMSFSELLNSHLLQDTPDYGWGSSDSDGDDERDRW